jgi:hypothetical protein
VTQVARASRSHSGTAPDPVEWSVLEEIFIAIFGREARSLQTSLQTLQSVQALWVLANGDEHTATTLSEVAEAYSREETYQVRFSGRSERLEWCSFEYWPGGERPRAAAIVRGPPDEVDDMIAPVIAAFPVQRSVLFISWSGPLGKRVAEALRDLIEPKMPPGGEVFFSPEIPAGENPLKVMLDKNLKVADAHVAVVTPDAVESHWVIWEVAASWARRKTLIPLFVRLDPTEVKGPLQRLVDGVKLDNATQLTRAIDQLVSAVGGKSGSPLSAEDFTSLQQAAQ